MGVALTSSAVEMEFSTGVWTDVIADVQASTGLTVEYGIRGNDPKDRVASTGFMDFYLQNHAGNSASTQGYYSPNHGSVRSGFTYGTGTRLKLTYGGTSYYKFCGKLADIEPEPGQYLRQLTRCQAVDWIDEAAATKVRDSHADSTRATYSPTRHVRLQG